MHQDSFRSVVCRSLSKNPPSRSKDGSYPETVQCDVPCVVTLPPLLCRGCQGRERSSSRSNREERSMSLHRDYLMAPSLSKHFAEDLLRGAMDLQESLAMLERFQAASQSMRESNNKRRAGRNSPEIDTIIREILLRPSNGKQVLPKTVSDGLPRQLSNSNDNLKNVVKDGLYRKNILSVSYNNEQASLSQSTRYSPDSYSMSKITQQKKVAPISFPSCASVPSENSKSPSFVAKLMGLDGLPTQSDNSIKKDEKMVTVSSPRAQFDIEIPKSKRLVPRLIGLDSQFDMEMPRSEKLPREHHNVRTNYTCSQKGVLHSYDTPVVNETGSRNMSQRAKNIVQDRAKSPKEIKVVSPTSRKQHAEETTDISRRTMEDKRSHLTVRNGGGRKDVKTRAGPASSNAKRVKTPDKKLVASSSSHAGGSMKPILPKAPNKSREKTVSRRNVKSSTIDEIVAHQIQIEIIHALDQIDAPSTEYSATPSDESGQSAEWDAESSKDDIRNDFSEFNEALLPTSHAERISPSDGDTTHPSTNEITIKEAEIKDDISLLLLSDQTFLRRAAELTGIGAYKHLTNQYEGISKAEMKNHKLYLDTAAEQLERIHRQQNSLCYTGFEGQKCRVTTYFSLEALLTDVSNGIRLLNGDSDEDTGGTKDSLDMKVERDLRCANPLINGVWDMGWQDWICMEETECFIRDAGEDILSLIIEEAALEMCIH